MSVLFDVEGCSLRHSPKLKTLLACIKIFYVSCLESDDDDTPARDIRDL